MKEWQKLSETEMDGFINTVCQKLNITTWSGIDMADIYEKAVAIKSLQNTSSNSDYAKCADEIQLYYEDRDDVYQSEIIKIIKKYFA